MVATYDPVHQNILAFGGDSRMPGEATLVYDSDTWAWDGLEWTESAVSGPSLIAPSIAFDPTSGKVILTGANGTTDSVNETWSWNGSSWQQLHPVASPPARIQSALAEDPSAGQLVLFGGLQTNGKLSDTWVWNGSTWIRKQVTGPTARSDAAMAFDQQSGVVVLFGGNGNAGPSPETWTWDGSSWTRMSPVHSGPAFASAVETSTHVLLANGIGDVAAWTGQEWQSQ